MVFRGPAAGKCGAVVLLATLAACGSDPPEAKPPQRSVRPVAVVSSPIPAAVVPTLAIPVKASAAVVAQSAQPPRAAGGSADALAPASYPPKDECAKLPGFAAFRNSLFAAVRKRDSAALSLLADPAINLDFGGGSGTAELRKRLESNPALWDELSALEGLGCAEDGGVVTIPWIFSRMPDAIDPYSALLVAGAGVPLRAKAAVDATEVAKLDWVLVEAVKSPESGAFREVTSGKLRGYIENAKLRSVIDYRLIADRQNGEWKLTAFVAGD